MQIHKKFFPEVLSDNEMTYFAHLQGIIDSVDELCNLQVTKNPHSYHFRIAPSVPMYTQPLLEELLKFHNMFQIHLNMSKSIKSSSTINFEINLEN
tara:strand:+ start:708 stop:995 length:288 start_codon:yes stop_codon:yes gene_type:complete